MDGLEPQAAEAVKQFPAAKDQEQVMLLQVAEVALSIAISLKRLADLQEEFLRMAQHGEIK